MAKTVNIRMTYHSSSDIENMIIDTIDKYYQGGMIYKGTIKSTDDLPLTYKEGDTYTMIDGENSWLVIANVTRDYEGNYDSTHWQIVLSNSTGEVTADKVKLSENIQLSGTYTTIGNLDKNSENNILEEGQSLQDVLEEMLSKELYPTTVAPTGSIALANTNTSVEVGTKVVIGYSFEFTPGKFKYDDGTYAATEGMEPTYFIDDKEVSKSGSLEEFLAEDGGKYSVSGKIKYTASNPGVTKPNGNETEIVVPAGELSGLVSASISTYRNMYYYCGLKSKVDNLGELDSVKIRDGEVFTSIKSSTSVLEIKGEALPDQTGVIMVIMPENKKIEKVEKVGGGLSIEVTVSEFVKSDPIQVTGANKEYPMSYNIYTYNPSNLAADTYKIYIK